ncbi:hypothetical protein ACIQPP_05455 [Streptomyces violaceusniger]|uniref:hypothetical protein n=1 Tax=Streptomyces violaceusniger TaxID=68280 RepID=UPI000995E166|nr:hypothetical protein [Streptomyces hygroscopicus]AQW55267.1 hypothetical protein SHXM_08730 [Streptomyces hygroscopicus]
MTMTYDEVTPDSRVICHSRGDIKGTVLTKRPDGFGESKPIVRIAFDNGGEGYNYPEQLSPLDEAAPAPKLRASGYKGVSSFFMGGDEYHVQNSACGARGFWQVIRRREDGKAATNADYLIAGAATRKAAFDAAVAKLEARKTRP